MRPNYGPVAVRGELSAARGRERRCSASAPVSWSTSHQPMPPTLHKSTAMPDPKAEVTLVSGTEQVRVTGRAALLISLIALHADRVNAVPVGRLIAHFAQGQVKLELVESVPAVRLDP